MTSSAIEKHKKLYSKAKRLTDTINKHHRTAYDAAVDKHLTDKDGLVDMEKLDNSNVQKKFVDEMTDIYLSKAKQALGVKGKGKMEDQLILKSYMGITKHELNYIVKATGSDYHFNAHNQHMNKIVEDKIDPILQSSASAHIKSKDIDDILQYTKADKFVDSKKISKIEAIGLLTEYHEEKQLVPKKYRHRTFYKK
jgi:hypothetical protein